MLLCWLSYSREGTWEWSTRWFNFETKTIRWLLFLKSQQMGWGNACEFVICSTPRLWKQVTLQLDLMFTRCKQPGLVSEDECGMRKRRIRVPTILWGILGKEKVEASARGSGEEVRIWRMFCIYEGENYGLRFVFHTSLDSPKFLSMSTHCSP